MKSATLNRYNELNELSKKIASEMKGLKAEIVKHMTSNGLTTMRDETAGIDVSYTSADRTTLDTKALKLEKPDVYSVYSRTTEVNTLKVVKNNIK